MAYDHAFRFAGAAAVKKASEQRFSSNTARPELRNAQPMPLVWGTQAVARRRPLPTVARSRKSAGTEIERISPPFPADSGWYHANLPIIALAFRDNHQAAVTIPENEVLEVTGSAPDDRFVIVRVREEELLVFASDLHDRGKRLEDSDALLADSATA